MTGFLDLRFPVSISAGSKGGPSYNTSIIEVLSGEEKRNSNWDYPRAEYDVGFGIKEWEDLESLIEMFHVVKGRGYSFRYKDYLDYKSCSISEEPSETDQLIGTGDGSTEAFQIYKTYTKTSLAGTPIYTQVRKITKIVEDTFLLALNTVPKTTGFTLDETTGIVTFTTQDFTITNVDIDSTANWIKVGGDQSSIIIAGDSIEIEDSTANDAVYTVASVTYISGESKTQIELTEALIDETVDGTIKHGQPGDGVSITVGYEFDVHVRFDIDKISANLDDYNSGTINISLVEVK